MFYNITRFLITKNRISEAKQSRAFIRGFQPNLWACITARLELKQPDHHPDDTYKLVDIHEAASHILTGTATTAGPQHIHPNSAALPPLPIAATSALATAPQIKTEDFSAILDKFASTLMTALDGNKNANNRPNGGLHQDQAENLVCIFCGLSGHFISDC
jgi:hypothetical protein